MSLLNDITLKRLWSKISPQPNGCWNFDGGYKWDDGYPCFWFEGKSWRAGRLVLWLFNGQHPADKPHALHRCNNPACINPAHLYWGDDVDNRADLLKDNPDSASFAAQFKPGHAASWNGRRVLLDSQVAYIKRLLEAGYGVKEVARWYAVSPTPVERIKSGHNYAHVQPATLVPCGCHVRKPDPAFGRRTLTSHDAREIRARFAAGEGKSALALEYGVGQPAIHKTVLGLRWKEVA